MCNRGVLDRVGDGLGPGSATRSEGPILGISLLCEFDREVLDGLALLDAGVLDPDSRRVGHDGGIV